MTASPPGSHGSNGARAVSQLAPEGLPVVFKSSVNSGQEKDNSHEAPLWGGTVRHNSFLLAELPVEDEM